MKNKAVKILFKTTREETVIMDFLDAFDMFVLENPASTTDLVWQYYNDHKNGY